jgi:hypothetical protein
MGIAPFHHHLVFCNKCLQDFHQISENGKNALPAIYKRIELSKRVFTSHMEKRKLPASFSNKLLKAEEAMVGHYKSIDLDDLTKCSRIAYCTLASHQISRIDFFQSKL